MTDETAGSQAHAATARTPVRVGGVDISDLPHLGGLLNAPGRRLTWLTILKASVAVALAWQVASALPGDDAPVFAPIVALTTVQSSLYGTLAQGFQTVAGNITGVALPPSSSTSRAAPRSPCSWQPSSVWPSRSACRSAPAPEAR